MTSQKHHNCCDTPVIDTPEELAVCPVMQEAVNKKDAELKELVRTYAGKTYYLCCDTCATKFDENPSKYTEE